MDMWKNPYKSNSQQYYMCTINGSSNCGENEEKPVVLVWVCAKMSFKCSYQKIDHVSFFNALKEDLFGVKEYGLR